MKPLAPNTMIQNRYLVVHLVGKGGMGEVYLAVDQRLGSAVALKRTYFADDQTLGNAFEREAKILARLRHPVLPKVSDHFLEDGEQYLVMEHIAGEDMSKRLETAKRPFPLTWVMFWADQLLDALGYLHSHEPPIIHRDIKPQNLKLTDENHIVLLDFGLSKDSSMRTVTDPATSGSIVGYTPHFAAMEQIRGTGTNPRSDLYSLSATLYQLMTNTVPVDALARADAIIGGSTDPIVPLSDINRDIPRVISDIILKGIELSQDKRFQTAMEMQKALRRAYTQTKDEVAASSGSYSAAKMAVPTPARPVSAPSVKPTDDEVIVASFTPTRESEAPTTLQPKEPEVPAFDATLQMNPVETNEALRKGEIHNHPTVPKQADVKTEVLLAGDIPDLPELKIGTPFGVSKPAHVPAPSSTLNPSTNGDDSRHDPFSNSGNAGNPASGLPTFSSDLESLGLGKEIGAPAAKTDGDGLSGFAPLPPVPDSREPAAPDFFSSPNIAIPADKLDVLPPVPEARVEPTPPSPSQPKIVPPPPQKSSANPVLILGGMAAVFVMILVALGGGYYVYTNYYEGGGPEPTPVPRPSVEASPSPESTPDFGSTGTNNNDNSEPSNTNRDTGNTNTQIDPPVNSNPVNHGTTSTPVPGPTAGPFSTPRPTPAPVNRGTTPKTNTAASPKTPKPGGPVIHQ